MACAVARARPAVSGTSSNRAAKPAMLSSSSEPWNFMVVQGCQVRRPGVGEIRELQKRRASSKLSGHFIRRLNESQHNLTLRVMVNPDIGQNTPWTSSLEVWGTS